MTHIDIAIRTIWDEARGEGYDGMRAVAHAIINRAKNVRRWPDKIGWVCTEPKQFSGWNTEAGERRADMLSVDVENAQFLDATRAMLDALVSGSTDPTGGADHFVNLDIFQPSWATPDTFTVKIGAHSFYKRG